jgi:periplasmic protein TonB
MNLSLSTWTLRPSAAIVALALTLVAGCGDEPPQQRRMQTVRLLPDTPPPPPPPPPKDKAPEPQKEAKPQPQTPDNKPPEPDQQAALKSDEAAGDGPGSGLTAGNVTKDYTDQKLGNQPQIGGSGFDAAARLAATSFANTTTRSLNEYLARDRTLKRSDYRVRVNLWLGPNGSVQRAELADSTGDPETDRALNEALRRFPGASTPLPQALQQPLRLQVTNRMLG